MLGRILVGVLFILLGVVVTVAPQHMSEGMQNLGALGGFTLWLVGGVLILVALFDWGPPKGVPRRWS